MSGIYGIYRFDGAPVDPDWVERMRAAMAYYGPDGGSSLLEGSLALGHLLLKINPEDEFQQQPIASERGLLVTAARLDNRDELLDAFGLSASAAAETSDGRLASLAWDRWGKDLCQHLQGDWALVAWDRRQRELLLARDACGNATLYWHQGHGFIAFASNMKALLALPGAIKKPDEIFLSQLLCCRFQDPERTAYRDYRRLIWASSLSIHSGGEKTFRQYWSPYGRESLRLRRDEEYVEAFLSLYENAVRNCLRTRKQLAATLSCGRDSSSVVAMAAPILARQGRSLPAYTSVPFWPPDGAAEDRTGNEWELAHGAASMSGENILHTGLDARNESMLESMEYLIGLHEQPSHGSMHHFSLRALLRKAADDRCGVVLLGQHGNGSVSWAGTGSALLSLSQGGIAQALCSLHTSESNPWLTLKRSLLKPAIDPLRRSWNRYHNQREAAALQLAQMTALHPQIIKQLDLTSFLCAYQSGPSGTVKPGQDVLPRMFSLDRCIGRGFWSELGAGSGLVFMDPTANLALCEFILRVPDTQFYRAGQKSSLFQRAFQNRLPEAILRGTRRGLQSADAGYRIRHEFSDIKARLTELAHHPPARDFLNLELMERYLLEVENRVDPGTHLKASSVLMRGIGVGMFLQRFA